MKVISTGLLTHISQDTTTLATCVKMTRRDGVVMAYTTHDKPLMFDCDGLGAVTYQPQGGYKRSAIESQLGLAADNLELEGLIQDDAIDEDDLLKGVYDNAALKFMLVNWADLTQGVLKLRRGYVGQITVHRDTYIAEVRGLMDAYSTVIGELYTPDCTADLGDARCQVDLSGVPRTVTCTVTTVQAPGPGEGGTHTFSVTPDCSAIAPGGEGLLPWFAMGKAAWLTGANAGTAGELKAWDQATSTATLFLASTFPMVPGDTLTLTVGCDKRRVTCRDRFDNIVNFRGFPYVPGLDKALEYPSPHTVQPE
jgi:uncharacterized phage protein (TIGR02218 family)